MYIWKIENKLEFQWKKIKRSNFNKKKLIINKLKYAPVIISIDNKGFSS